ncbi:polyprenol monophosphomannose synthase [Ferrimicrobium sp.]|uniref:polyprenol monophosphomannose synthase n=1 Tax=Ferrimicrobium sp. TaxID=2926050 RepID=UPI00262FB37B|nr:polyprenol monophosphomannose synthase [Ferrimicrobium sp.]
MGHTASQHPWVIVPTYNEASNIVDIVKAIREAVPASTVLVVDDSSPDGTADLVEGLRTTDSCIRVLRRPGKAGLGAAYRSGFRQALDSGATALVEIDADFSHDPAVIPSLLQSLDDGAGLAIGSRYVAGGSSEGLPAMRLLISRLGNRYASLMLGMKVHDATAGFRAYEAGAMKMIDLDRVRADGYGFQVEMAYLISQLGFRITEVPITFHDRRAGSSKMSSHIVVEAMMLCTIWGLSRRVAWLRQGSRQDRLIDQLEKLIRMSK